MINFEKEVGVFFGPNLKSAVEQACERFECDPDELEPPLRSPELDRYVGEAIPYRELILAGEMWIRCAGCGIVVDELEYDFVKNRRLEIHAIPELDAVFCSEECLRREAMAAVKELH